MIKESDKQLYQEIKAEVNKIITFDEFNTAKELINNIKDLIKKKNYIKHNKELYNKYRKIIIKLKWVAFPLLGRKEVLELFNNHFQRALEMENFDLQGKFKHFLIGIIMHEDRDKFKSKVKHILERSKAIITSKKLSNNQPPTIENWIKSYTSELGIGIVEALKLHQYFIHNRDFKNLSDNEKKKLKKFFEFYERLKLSSLTAAGIEEIIPINTPEFKGQIREGRLEKEEKRLDIKTKKIMELAKQAIENIENLNEIAEHYKISNLEKKAIKEEIKEEKRIEELESLASQYPENSLERKAIEEEINKIKNKNKI